MQTKSQAQQCCIFRSVFPAEPRQRAEYKTSGSCRVAPSPIRVGPLIDWSELEDRKQPSEQRPGWRGPAPQHPIAERAESRGREQHPGPGGSKNDPSDSQCQSLTDRIDGTVSRRLQDEEC